MSSPAAAAPRRPFHRRRKTCPFSGDKAPKIDYKDVRLLQRYPPDVNHENWPRIVRMLAERGGFAVQDIDLAIFTQVRLPSIKLVMEDLGLPLEKTHWVMDKWGYTGSACIGMCLDDAVDHGKVKSGDLVTLVGSGVGYNYAGVALRMP